MNNPFNEESTQVYVGEKRSGKTLSMVADTFELIKNLNPQPIVYANFHLNSKYFHNFKYITLQELENFYKNKEEFKKCFFLIDEGHTFLDSRNSFDKKNKTIGYLVGQMGKRGNIMKINTHFPRLIDVRIRLYCEKWIYVSKLFYDFDNKLRMIQNYNREVKPKDYNRIFIFCEPVIRKLIGFDFVDTPLRNYVLCAKKYFDMYDTEEMITPIQE